MSYYPPRNPRLYLASPRGGLWRPLTRPSDQPGRLVGWSAAGAIAYSAPPIGTVRVVDTRGRVLLDAAGGKAWWSPGGRLAVARSSVQIDVYDAALKRAGSYAGINAAWSADDSVPLLNSTARSRTRCSIDCTSASAPSPVCTSDTAS